jgi:hypothetical protein
MASTEGNTFAAKLVSPLKTCFASILELWKGRERVTGFT